MNEREKNEKLTKKESERERERDREEMVGRQTSQKKSSKQT